MAQENDREGPVGGYHLYVSGPLPNTRPSGFREGASEIASGFGVIGREITTDVASGVRKIAKKFSELKDRAKEDVAAWKKRVMAAGGYKEYYKKWLKEAYAGLAKEGHVITQKLHDGAVQAIRALTRAEDELFQFAAEEWSAIKASLHEAEQVRTEEVQGEEREASLVDAILAGKQ